MFAISVPIPPCVVDPANYKNLHFGWCPRGGAAAYYTIGYNGLLRPCNHSSRILGDLRRRSFAEILDSAENREFWSGIPQRCLDCPHPLAESCMGGCPAASDECYGSRERMDPFVPLALGLGQLQAGDMLAHPEPVNLREGGMQSPRA